MKTETGVAVIIAFVLGIAFKSTVDDGGFGFISTAHADVAGMDYRDLQRDRDFERAVEEIVEDLLEDGDFNYVIEYIVEDCEVVGREIDC